MDNKQQRRTTKCDLNPAVTTTTTTAKYFIAMKIIDVCSSEWCTDAMYCQLHVGSRVYRSMKKAQYYPITIVDSVHYPRL